MCTLFVCLKALFRLTRPKWRWIQWVLISSVQILEIFIWYKEFVLCACFNLIWIYMGGIKRKSVFEHAQNMRIHKSCISAISSGQVLSIETFYSIQWFCLRTAKALIRLRGCAGWSGPSLSAYVQRHVFAWRGLYYLNQMNRNVGKRTFFHTATKAEFDQRLRCPHEETLHSWLSKMRPVRVLIRLRECAGWSESSRSAHKRFLALRLKLLWYLCDQLLFFCRCMEGQHAWRRNRTSRRKPNRYLFERSPILQPHVKSLRWHFEDLEF